MSRTKCIVSALLCAGLFTSTAVADQYNFDVGLGYTSSEFDGSQTITTNGGTVFNSVSSDTDDVRFVGNWYFSGLSDDKGPRARATLVDRASALSFAYSRSERTLATILTSTDPAFPFPPLDSTFEADADTYAADLRYVDRASGWIGVVGTFTGATTLGGIANGSADADAWRLGVGKYVFEKTIVGLNLTWADSDGGQDSTTVDVLVEHLGDLGTDWQYAVDASYSRVDVDGGFELDTWRAALSLYPTWDFEFGVGIEDTSGGFGQDALGVEGFVSWFITPRLRVSGGYRVDDVDFVGNVFVGGATAQSDTDQSSFRIGASLRF